MRNINSLLDKIEKRVEAHRLAPGEYCRFLWQHPSGGRVMGRNAYGCADAANILYTLGKFPRDPAERAASVAALRSFQSQKTGLFLESSHHIVHTTAHCIAALELFEEGPLYPLRDLLRYRDIEVFFAEMEAAEWLKRGRMAHFGAGLFASLVITETVDDAWIARYFDFFDKSCSPETGMWMKPPVEDFPRRLQCGDTFHFLFNYQHMHHPIPYPDRLIDSCLSMYREGMYTEGNLRPLFGKQFHFIEMDWVYCLNRATRETPHRFHEVKETLASFADGYLDYLESVDFETDDGANDLHLLFGVTCCLAELAAALPGYLYSSRPLRLTLDRRPFI